MALLTLSSVSAFAFHPEDTDLVSNIGVGSQVIVTVDVNIKPNTSFIYGGIDCYISLKKSEDYDQVLKAGTVFTIVSTKQEQYRQILTVDNPKVNYIRCEVSSTIGQLKQDFKANFKIQLATPTKF